MFIRGIFRGCLYALEPVEGLDEGLLVGHIFKLVGRALEGNLIVGATGVAVSDYAVKPEDEIKQIEWYQEQGKLLPQMDSLMADFRWSQRLARVKDKWENCYCMIATGRKNASMDKDGFH